MARAIVYIDGFNFYYGSLRGEAGLRWLDLGEFARKMLPRDEVVEIKYFTALVDKRPDNPDGCERQATYLRALKTIPNLSVYLGRFLTTEIYARRVYPAKVGTNRKNVKVYKTEEKGSDVNLACELLIDGFKGNYELAVVVSNDGDLKHPVHHVRHELGLPVGVLNPRQYRSRALSPNPLPKGSFYKPIRRGVLESSQFPVQIQDAQGTFERPENWA